MKVFILPLAVVAMGACAMHQVAPEAFSPVAVPEAFSLGEGSPLPEDPWWRAYGDPGLTRAVEAALAGNLDLAGAWARVRQARAVARQAGAGSWPQVDIQVGASRQQTNFDLGEPIGVRTIETQSYPLSIGAAYEVDLWGRLSHQRSATSEEAAAVADDAAALAMTLQAQVVETWFALAEQIAQEALLREQLRMAQSHLDLVETRFSHGSGTALDIRQQRQQVAGLRSELPLLASRRQVLAHQLAILKGQAPVAPALDVPTPKLAKSPSVAQAGIPAALLHRRPDVRAARRRVAAADHRVGTALADRFPRLQLSASTGYQDRALDSLLTNWVWNLAANLVAPMVDGGRREAEVAGRRAVLDERVAAYGASVLRALGEVEDALTRRARQGEHIEALDRQLVEARKTHMEARSRYTQGLVDYLPVLRALEGVQQIERRRLSSHRQWLSYDVQLARALGGGWEGPPPVDVGAAEAAP